MAGGLETEEDLQVLALPTWPQGTLFLTALLDFKRWSTSKPSEGLGNESKWLMRLTGVQVEAEFERLLAEERPFQVTSAARGARCSCLKLTSCKSGCESSLFFTCFEAQAALLTHFKSQV